MTLRQEPQGSFFFWATPTTMVAFNLPARVSARPKRQRRLRRKIIVVREQTNSVGRANFDYYAPRAHRNVNDVLSTDCALARWRAGVLLRRGGQIAVSHDGPPSESRSVTSR